MTVRLSDCKKGDRLKIHAIGAGRGATLNLMSMGLDVGHEIELAQRSPLKGPLLILHHGTEIAVGYGMAEKILVERIE